jgi:hypothetical protein
MMDKKVKVLRVFISLVFAVILASLSSCEKYTWTPPEPPVIVEDIVISFDNHIVKKCQGCHSWTVTKFYNELSSKVDTVTPANSRIFDIHGSVNGFNTMIQVNDTLQYSFVDVIKLWASQGARDNK